MTEKTLATKRVYNGKVLNVRYDDVELENGRETFREVVELSGGVVIVAGTTTETVFMVKQYRYAIGREAIELPAGKLDRGELPDACARRELEEETGYIAKNWKSLGLIHPSLGFSNETLHLYKAENLTKTQMHLDEGEILECIEYKIKDVIRMIKSGEINDAKTICAIARAYL